MYFNYARYVKLNEVLYNEFDTYGSAFSVFKLSQGRHVEIFPWYLAFSMVV